MTPVSWLRDCLISSPMLANSSSKSPMKFETDPPSRTVMQSQESAPKGKKREDAFLALQESRVEGAPSLLTVTQTQTLLVHVLGHGLCEDSPSEHDLEEHVLDSLLRVSNRDIDCSSGLVVTFILR